MSAFVKADADINDSASQNYEVLEGNNYEFILESGSLSLFADMQTGLFYIIDKNTGYKFYSIPQDTDSDKKTSKKDKLKYESQIVLEYTSEEALSQGNSTPSVINSKVGCVNKGTVSAKKIDNGIKVVYKFESIGMTIPVEYALIDGVFNASIVASDINEGNEFILCRVHLLPSFGAGNFNEEGYLFIPDGCGALVEFNNNCINNVYDAAVYGDEISVKKDQKESDTENVRMPVFGICRNENTLMGLITLGDTSASIDAYGGNDTCGLNSVYSVMNYRTIDSDEMISQSSSSRMIYRISDLHYDLKKYTVSYYTLSKDESNYNGIAKKYREYLKKEQNVSGSDNSSLINLNIYGAVETVGNFAGWRYKKLLPLTEYEQVSTILENLGITDTAIRYFGWQNDGAFNLRQVNKSKLISCLGGNKGWTKLQKYLDKNKITATYDIDFIRYRKGLFTSPTKTMFGKKAFQNEYLRSVYSTSLLIDSWLLLTTDKVQSNAKKYLKSLDESCKNLSLSTLTNLIYSDFGSKKGEYRSSFSKAVQNTLSLYKESGKIISGDEANAYTFAYLDKIYNTPTSTSGYKFFDKEIPFYQIALHGVIPMTVSASQTELNTDQEFLKAVESGSELLYNCMYNDASVVSTLRESDLYGSNYSMIKDKVVEQYSKYNDLFKQICDQEIISHREIEANVTETTFANGTDVIVNFGYDNLNVGDIKVDARSFAVRRGDGAK